MRVDIIPVLILIGSHSFGYHNFTKQEIVSTVSQTFTDFPSSWWDVYCVDNIDNKPITWNELKSVLKHRFVPPAYQHEMFRKLARLEQGSNTVHVYYLELKSYMYHCDIKESKELTRNMFYNGLN
jgi:hypothetical protein